MPNFYATRNSHCRRFSELAKLAGVATDLANGHGVTFVGIRSPRTERFRRMTRSMVREEVGLLKCRRHGR
jgi:hypothetical protein